MIEMLLGVIEGMPQSYATAPRMASPRPFDVWTRLVQDRAMEFFWVVETRRSVRKYLPEPVDAAVVEKAIDAALLAPNSSNLQTWEFHWVRSEPRRAALIEACLNQNAARTSQHLIVAVANPTLWKKHVEAILAQADQANAPAIVRQYYQKLIPLLYGWAWLAPLKWLLFNVVGFMRPISRRPWSRRDVDEISIKSTALACENFMLAITAQGYDTCPMEGFDERRVKKLLGLSCRARVVMVISVGKRDPKGLWGERFRVPRDWVVKTV